MAKPDNNILHKQEFARLVLAVFTAFCVGFILAMFLGEADKLSHEWASILVSAIAAAISGYAVYLVNKTLQATRDMADSQKHIGNLQTRAWLSYDDAEVIAHPGGLIEFVACIRNYGATPAKNINISCQAIILGLPTYLVSEDEEHVELIDLPPNKGATCSTGMFEIPDGFGALMRVGWNYKTTSRYDDDNGSIFLLLKVIDGKKQLQPLTQSDFYNLDIECNCNSKLIIKDFLNQQLIDINIQIDPKEQL